MPQILDVAVSKFPQKGIFGALAKREDRTGNKTCSNCKLGVNSTRKCRMRKCTHWEDHVRGVLPGLISVDARLSV